MKQIKKLTWLQACFLGDMGVIWCNTLGDSLFQILCDEFCRICAWLLFTYHITCISSFCSLHTLHKLLFARLCTCYCVWFCFGHPRLKIPWFWCKMCLQFEILGQIDWKSCFWKIWVKFKGFWKSFHLILRHFIHKTLCFEEFLH